MPQFPTVINDKLHKNAETVQKEKVNYVQKL